MKKLFSTIVSVALLSLSMRMAGAIGSLGMNEVKLPAAPGMGVFLSATGTMGSLGIAR